MRKDDKQESRNDNKGADNIADHVAIRPEDYYEHREHGRQER